MNRLIATVRPYGMQIGVLLGVIVILGVLDPSLFGTSWIFSTLDGFTLVGIIALGIAVTMAAGELDMSVASTAACAGVIAVKAQDLGLVPAIMLSVAFGVGVGMAQGYLIHRLGINSLVFTIGTLLLLRGLAYVFSSNAPIVSTSFGPSDSLLTRWGFLSPGILMALALFAAVGLFLGLTRAGREIFAIGGARVEATAAGVPIRRTIVVAFAISGGCAGLAGGLASIKSASATPDAFGDLLVAALSAVLIGGMSMYGGRGSVWNVVLGVAVVCALSAGMTASGAPTYVATLVTGGLLFALIAIDYLRNNAYRGRGSVFGMGTS